MKQLLQSEFNKGGKTYKNVSSPETSGTQSQVTTIILDGSVLKISTDNGATFLDIVTTQSNTNANEIDGIQSQISTMLSDIETAVTNIANLTSNTTLIENSDGGFSAGNGATAMWGGAVGYSATAGQGGAVGLSATAKSGGAVGNGATATTGGAIGNGATATSGGAIGSGAKADSGGAIGIVATAGQGGAVGHSATAGEGGAIGSEAKAGRGFSGGYNAQVVKDSDGNYMDAIQLGTGTNNTPKTLQVYNHKVYNSTNDSLYCSYINDKTPAVVETVWSGTLKNDGTTSITIPNVATYDYFILYGTMNGRFCNIIANIDGVYGFTKKSESSSSIMLYEFSLTAGSLTWGTAGYYESGNFTFVDRTGTSFYNLYKIEGVKICKA